jgi:hypothetical protein
MKVREKKFNTYEVNGVSRSINFGINAKGLPQILHILRNQLYSDKISAVIREYSVNAVDAHIESGQSNRPIEITLPSQLDCNFKVRDYGFSLSDKDIEEVFAFYGESTKRNTNTQTGMLGIGAKSAFAYGDNFVINSYIDGRKHVYNAFIDPSQLGMISKLTEEDTDEENGVEIVVPVKDKDVQSFVEKAENLFEHFKVRPKIAGNVIEFNDEDVLFSGDDWVWKKSEDDHSRYHGYGSNRRGNSEPIAVMGNIGYKIDSYSIDWNDEDYSGILIGNLVLEFDIGEIEITASREGLEYTEITISAIKAKLKKVHKELLATIQAQFDGCDSLFKAKCLIGEVLDLTSGLASIRSLILKDLKWKGAVIKDQFFHIGESSGVSLRKVGKSPRASKPMLKETCSIECNKDVVVVENDTGTVRGLLGNVYSLVAEDKKTVYIIQYDDGGIKKEVVEKENFDAKIILLSTLPKRKMSEFGWGGNKHNAKVSAKSLSKEFIVNWDEISNGVRGCGRKPKSTFWKREDVDVEIAEGVYVIINRFKINGIKSHDALYKFRDDNGLCPTKLEDAKRLLSCLGIELPETIYGFKKSVAEKAEGNKNLIELWDWIELEIRNKIRLEGLEQVFADSDELKGLEGGIETAYQVFQNNKVKIGEINNESVFAKSVKKLSSHHDTYSKVSNQKNAAEHFGVRMDDVKSQYNADSINKLFDELYPMIRHLSTYGHSRDDELINCIINYVNEIDGLTKK